MLIGYVNTVGENFLHMEREIDNDTKKMRILNYLDYMDDKSLREISVALYNLSIRRREVKKQKELVNESGK